MTRVAFYARFSDSKQSEFSVDDQLRLCRDRAATEGWQVVGEFADRAISGATMFLRRGIQELLDGIRNRDFDVILAESIDRLSRDQEDIAHIYKRACHSDIRIVTIAEGAISELHIGLKGTMGALYLKDLAQKTHRGLQGRAIAGKSAGGSCYGYETVRRFDERGELIRGDRKINDTEAAIVVRIFEDFVAGKSAKRIAVDLNREGIAAPTGGEWGHSTINGNRRRGTGILNNELYIGQQVWNRQRFVKNPDTGKREARPNPESEWVITEVPELRIVPQELWDRVKSFQRRLDDRTEFWQKQRPKRLLSGMCRCGHCGGGFSKVSATHMGCATARNKGTCESRLTISVQALEERVLGALRAKLMQPELCEVFCAEYTSHMNKLRSEHNATLAGYQAELERTKQSIENMLDQMMYQGVDPRLLKDRVNALGARRFELEALLQSTPEAPILFHPNMSQHYAAEVQNLIGTLNDADHRAEAANTLRGLIDRIELTPNAEGTELIVDLYGDLAGILQIATNGDLEVAQSKTAPRGGGSKLVAGTGFEPVTFRL